MAWLNIRFKNWTVNKALLEEDNYLNCLPPMYSFSVTGDAQCGDGECIETGNGNHICIVILLCIALLYYVCVVISVPCSITFLN